jgi:hypothetical protein
MQIIRVPGIVRILVSVKAVLMRMVVVEVREIKIIKGDNRITTGVLIENHDTIRNNTRSNNFVGSHAPNNTAEI